MRPDPHRPSTLTIDARFAPEPPGDPDAAYFELGELAALVRRPSELLQRIRRRRFDVVRIMVDGTPPSAPQAAMLVIAACADCSRFEVHRAGRVRRLGRLSLVARGLPAGVVATVREVGGSLRALRRIRRFLAEPVPAPRPVDDARSVAYLRPAPTLRYLGEYVGGAAAHTTGVINGLVRNGLDVEVYAPERPEGIGGSFREVALRRVYHLVAWLTVAAYGHEVVRAAAGSRAQFVYQRYVLGSHAGLELARRLRVPLVLEYNGSEVWTTKNWGSGRLPLVSDLTEIERRNVSDASLVVVVSEILRQELIDSGAEPQRVLANPNGVDTQALAPLRERTVEELRGGLGLRDVPHVGFVGTFGLWHGVKLLPRLVQIVGDELAEVRWVLVGDGKLHGEVREEIERLGLSDRVELTGVVAHDRALELLAACEVCVSPHVPNPDGSRFFGSPTKLFEYMGLGKAVVAADLEQIGDVLEHERTALMHEPGDVEAAAAAVLRLIRDPALRERLGAAALEEAQGTYSWDAHVRRILDALEHGVRTPVTASTP